MRSFSYLCWHIQEKSLNLPTKQIEITSQNLSKIMRAMNEQRNTFARRLQNLRKIRGISQAELVEEMKQLEQSNPEFKAVSSTAIERYENAVMYPESDAIMATIAAALHTTVDSLNRPFTVNIDCSKFEFRKKSKLGKKQQERIKLEIQQRIEKYVEIERIAGEEPQFDADFSDIIVRTESEAQKVADMLREKWSLGMGPIPQPILVLEMHGVKVIEVSENPELFDGTSNVVEGIPVVVINNCDSTRGNPKYHNNEERRRFTLWHEMGHKVMNIPADVDEKLREILCNVFAHEMLIPADTFKQIFGQKRQMISSWELKDVQFEYGISVRALMKKAEQLNVITHSRYTWFCVTMNKKENEKFQRYIDSSEIKPQHTSRYKRLVYRSLVSNIITLSKAADLLDISIEQLQKELDLLNINGNNC